MAAISPDAALNAADLPLWRRDDFLWRIVLHRAAWFAHLDYKGVSVKLNTHVTFVAPKIPHLAAALTRIAADCLPNDPLPDTYYETYTLPLATKLATLPVKALYWTRGEDRLLVLSDVLLPPAEVATLRREEGDFAALEIHVDVRNHATILEFEWPL